MRYVVFLFLYVIIGLGVAAGNEVSKKRDLTLQERNLAIMLWPGLLSAKAYLALTETHSKCESGGAA